MTDGERTTVEGMMGKGTRSLFVGLLLVSGLFGIGAGTAFNTEGPNQSADPVLSNGGLTAEASTGVLRALSSDVDVSLEADRLEVYVAWEYGYRAQDPDGLALYGMREDQDSDEEAMVREDASATFSAHDPEKPMNILALGEESETDRLNISSSSSSSIDAIEDRLLASHWENTTSANFESTGFWYTIEGPTSGVLGGDRGSVRGNFTLFANNITVAVQDQQGDKEIWQDWGGIEVRNPQSPAGALENPSAKEYEVRTILIEVTNGNLSVESEGNVELFGPLSNVETEGAIMAPSATGELHAAQDPVVSALTSRPALGAYATMLGLLVAGLTVAVAAPQRVHAWASAKKSQWRADRYERWVTTAEEHESASEFAKAEAWWQRLVSKYPDNPFPWFRLSLAQLERGEQEASLDTIREARENFSSLPTDFYEAQASIAWKQGHEEEALEAFEQLVARNADRALSMLKQDPKLDEMEEDARVRELLQDAGLTEDSYDQAYV